MKKKKIEFIARSIPNAIFFTIFGVIFSLALIPSKLKEYLILIKDMQVDVWYNDLKWSLCNKYGECEWDSAKNISLNSIELMIQTCKFCKNTQYVD